jgi:branched-chain amino acid aminotransferase
MFYATDGFIVPDADSTRFVLYVYESPMPKAKGFSAMLSSFRRPARDMAPTDAKASCHYPNSARALAEAEARGFDNAILLDPSGNVAEFAGSNLFLAKDGITITPAVNGTFLNGITRQRVIQLLRQAGVPVEERAVTYSEVRGADEIFSTGNYAKVTPLTRIEDRALQPGPIYRRARELYFKFAESARLV